MTQKRPLSAANTRQTDSEIETVLGQLAPIQEPAAVSEAHAPVPRAPAPTPKAHAPVPKAHAPRRGLHLAQFGSNLGWLAVGAFLVVSGRCAYLEHKISVVANEAAAIEARARACERRTPRPTPSAAPEERDVRPDLDDASRRIRGVGPIQQTAPGVFTNRDPDPAEVSPR
jgi:hypothetical protein